MLRTIVVISAMLLAGVASAQTQTAPAAAQTASPALIESGAIQTGDSPLVQAAKRSVAARKKSITVKIDNTTVRNATKLLTTTDTARTIPVFQPLPLPPQQQRPADTSATSKKPEQPKPRPADDAEGLYPEGVVEHPAAQPAARKPPQ